MTSRRSAKQTQTIQVWPSGWSVEFRGDPDGPANQRSLREGHYQAKLRCSPDCHRAYESDGITIEDDRMGRYCITDPVSLCLTICPICEGHGYTDNPKRNPWRKGTADEWRKVRIELRAELYAEREVQGCDSSLVDDLIKAANRGELSGDLDEGFSYDEIRNIYADTSDWDADTCRDYIRDNGLDEPDKPAVECPRCGGKGHTTNASCDNCDTAGHVPDPDAGEDDSRHGYLTELRDVCRDYAQDNPVEVMEWWCVSSWLCGQLHAIGEVTIDNNYGHWWGRCATGQQWIMDGVLQRVAALFEQGDK